MFSSVLIVDTEIIFGCNFETPLTLLVRTQIFTMELFSKRNLILMYYNDFDFISHLSIAAESDYYFHYSQYELS